VRAAPTTAAEPLPVMVKAHVGYDDGMAVGHPRCVQAELQHAFSYGMAVHVPRTRLPAPRGPRDPISCAQSCRGCPLRRV
jgi:hypothetical protein